MRVCIFTETYYPVVGGGETQARLLANALARKGVSVDILTRRSDRSLRREDRVDEAIVRRVGPTGPGHLKKWGLLVSSVPQLIRLQRRCDVIFVSGFRVVGMSAIAVARVFGKGCVLKADSQGEMSGDFFTAGLAKIGLRPGNSAFRWFLALRAVFLRRADAFVAITPDMVDEFLAIGVRRDAVLLIPNAVDTSRFAPIVPGEREDLRGRLGLPATAFIASYTGRLVSYKGLPRLLRVWRAIVREHPDAVLVLVGTGGLDIHNCEDSLRAYVQENGMIDNVRFTGSVDNVHDYLQASDAFVFPTENDAFPSSVVEAMACGLPVLSTPVGAIGSIISDGRNGLLVPQGDEAALERGLRALLGDGELASQLGQAARATVEERYSAEQVGETYLRLFEDVVSSRTRSGRRRGPEP